MTWNAFGHNPELQGVYASNTGDGIVICDARSGEDRYFTGPKRATWGQQMSRRGVWSRMEARLRTKYRMRDYSREQLLATVRPPIEYPQVVLMNGVTFRRSQAARNLEFWKGVLGPDITEEQIATLPQWFLERFRTPYDIVAETGNPHERFFSGLACHCTTTGGVAGFRGEIDLGNPRLRASDVPEPELVTGFSDQITPEWITVGADMTARRAEQRSSLLLFFAKVHAASAVLAHEVFVPNPAKMKFPFVDLSMTITRGGATEFSGETDTRKMVRKTRELFAGINACGPWPDGGVMYHGTGLVPKPDWTLAPGDGILIGTKRLGLYLDVSAEQVVVPDLPEFALQFEDEE